MAVQFTWEDDTTPRLRKPAVQRPHRHWLRRAVLPALVILVLGALLGTLYWMAAGKSAQAQADLETTITLEDQALAHGDTEVLAQFQDRADPAWIEQQATWARTKPQISQRRIRSLALHDQQAWVEVSWREAGDEHQGIEFYRREKGLWLHTGPVSAYWSSPREQVFGPLALRFGERDAPLAQSIGAELAQAVQGVCADLDCSRLTSPLSVALQPRYLDLERTADDVSLPSPRLRALDAAGQPSESWMRAARQAVIRPQVRRAAADLGPADIAGTVQEALVGWEDTLQDVPLPAETRPTADLQTVSQQFGPAGIAQVLAALRYLAHAESAPPPADWRPYFQMRVLAEARQQVEKANAAEIAHPVVVTATVSAGQARVQVTFERNSVSYRAVNLYTLADHAWTPWQGQSQDWGARQRETADGLTLVYQEVDGWWAAGLAVDIRRTMAEAQARLGLAQAPVQATIAVVGPEESYYTTDSAYMLSPLLKPGGSQSQLDRASLARDLAHHALLAYPLPRISRTPLGVGYYEAAVNWALKYDADHPDQRQLALQAAKVALDKGDWLGVTQVLRPGVSGAELSRTEVLRRIQMRFFFEYVAAQWGEQAIPALVQASTSSIPDWLQNGLHVSSEAFDAGWREYMRVQVAKVK